MGRLLPGLAGPAGRRRALVVLAVVLFPVVAGLRFADPNPMSGTAFLYVIPISLLAVRFGYRGVLAGGTVAMVLTAWWAHERDVFLGEGGYALRAAALLAVALVLGRQVERRKVMEGEADRWFNLSDDCCCVVSCDGLMTRVNESWTRHLGYPADELVGRDWLAHVDPDDRAAAAEHVASLAARAYEARTFECRFRAAGGATHWLLWSCRSDGQRIYASARDITDRKELEARLHALATEDKLTGLPNRRAWAQRSVEELARARRTGGSLTVAMLDLDELKQVNDTHGHAAGDGLIVEFAHAWRGAIRSCDFLARIGGDEFAVLLPDCDLERAQTVVERVQAERDDVRFSAGLATLVAGDSIDSLLARADAELYRAKTARRPGTIIRLTSWPAAAARTA